ncbi:E3 ubiquitin-protein ligase E3D [Porites harrisoni]
MADESVAVPVWCDVGVNLNAVSFVISLGCFTKGTITCGSKSKLIVRICSRELSCCCYKTDDKTWRALENTLQLPARFSLIPRSCTGLSASSGTEIQMRLHFEYCKSDSPEKVSKRHLLREELQELRSGCHNVCCRICGSAVLSPERKLKRVLELPSENWFELAQDWCCHGSSHLTSLTGVLDPSEDDCFVGEYFIRVHPAAAETNNLKIFSGEEHYQIKCCRCNSVLGSGSTEEKNHSSLHMELRDFNSINLHKHSISLRHSHLFRSYCTETYISSCLTSKSKGAVNFRFLVQESMQSGEKRTHACLWLFNPDTAVVTNIETCNFHCGKRPPEGGAYSITNKAKYMPVVKILYKARPLVDDSSWKDEVSSWEENPSVEVLTFTREICLHLILLLSQSTNTIAPSLRDMNGFKVGYLRTIEP